MYSFQNSLKNKPYPIHGIIHKYLRISEDNLNERHAHLCDIFECLIKFIAIIALKEGIIVDKKLNVRFPKGFDFLQHPSLGHWTSVIREFSNENWEDSILWLSKLSVWYKNNDPGLDINSLYSPIVEAGFQKSTSINAGIINSLVTYRNKVWKGHGAANLDSSSLKKRIPSLEILIARLIETADFLDNMNLFFVKEVKKLSGQKDEAKCVSLIGSDLHYSSFIWTNFEPLEVYLSYDGQKELNKAPLLLSPLVGWYKGENDNEGFYFFNDAKRSKLEYLSYIDSSFYYHKEIKKELQEIFKIDFERIGEDYDFIVYNHTEEQRKEKSRHFYYKGLELANRQNWEGSLLAFEDALEWYRSPEIIIAMCESLIALNENKEYILDTLEQVFELDPESEPAHILKQKLSTVEWQDEKLELIDDESLNLKEGNFTYFDLFVPAKFRMFSTSMLIIVIAVLYMLMGVALFMLDKQNSNVHISATILYLILNIIMVLEVFAVRNKLLDAYFPLLGQQANMRVERFAIWFKMQYRFMFGFIVKKGPKRNTKIRSISFFKTGLYLKYYSLNTDKEKYFWNEKVFTFAALAFVFAFSISNISIQQLYEYSLPVAIIRFIETTLVWLVMIPILRFLITSTQFIREYSNMELNPIVSDSGNNGFAYLNRIFISALLGFNLFWIFLWWWNLVVVTNPFYFDFIGLGLALLVSLFWTLFTPIYMRRALNLSRSMAIIDYDNHIKDAFAKHLKNPDANSLEKLNWLLDNQGRVNKISTRLFKFKHWVIMILSNINIIAVSVYYILVRLGVIEMFSFQKIFETISKSI